MIIQSVKPTSPNYPLQRTRPHITAPASTATFPPSMQVPRRTGMSLSVRSFDTEKK